MSTDPFKPLLSQLENIDSATLADVMVAMGLEQQVLSSNFKVLNPNSKLIGYALCAQAVSNSNHETVSPIQLDALVKKSSIVVIASNGTDKGALLGDNMLTSMMQNGATGFIVDGGIRDTNTLIESKAALLYRYTSPVNAYRFLGFSSFDKAVILEGIWGDVKVEPEDLIVADCDGAVVIPAQHAESIITDSEIHQKNEENIKSALTWGNTREESLKKYPRLKHVAKLTS